MKNAETVLHPFPPVADCRSRVLILGSFPSVKSREEGFYYGHPRNRFWPLIANLTGETLPVSIPEKERLLLSHGIALWDVIYQCEITGSSDQSVRNAVPNDIPGLVSQTGIRAVLCNGALSARLYGRYYSALPLPVISLPSTSPANASWSFEKLSSFWENAFQSLQIDITAKEW